jgi:segregation and condensation protein B
MEHTPNRSAALEAALFAYGEPMPRTALAELLGIPPDALDALLGEYKTLLEGSPERGLTLLDQGNRVQLVTKPETSSIISALFKAEVAEELTPAALETLSLITYFGPLTRAKLEYVRGVNSAFTLRNLLIRGLVERIPEPGRTNSYQYRASADLMRHVGVRTPEELPDYQNLRELLTRAENAAETETPGAPESVANGE